MKFWGRLVSLCNVQELCICVMRCVRLNGDLAVLPLAVPLDGSFTGLEPHTKEDFQKMLTEWQEHLGSLQVSDRAVCMVS
jgi:hypothetical protein